MLVMGVSTHELAQIAADDPIEGRTIIFPRDLVQGVPQVTDLLGMPLRLLQFPSY
jgi:hypothetical protein